MDKRFFEAMFKAAKPSPSGGQSATGPPMLAADITKGIYEGPDPCLIGKEALVRTLPHRKDKILVQFDDASLKEGHDWHEFDVSDFVLIVTIRGLD